MSKAPTILKNRSIISIAGEDNKTFLQGLITGDVNKTGNDKPQGAMVYALMLSPVGRFLYDFFIISKDEKLLLDCCSERADEIVQKLSFYKLRSKIEIKKEENLIVSVGMNHDLSKSVETDCDLSFIDPRNNKMGYRAFVEKNNAGEMPNNDLYNLRRIQLQIPDDSDLTFDKSFPLEFGFDNLNAIDYQKGCYVGQEVTARTHYKGTIRKKIFLVKIVDCDKIEKGAEIFSEDKKIGEILSSTFDQDHLLALALIKNIDNEGKEINLDQLKLMVANKEIKLIK